MTTGNNPLSTPAGDLTWIYRGDETSYTGVITKAVFLLSQDSRSVQRIRLECRWAKDAVNMIVNGFCKQVFLNLPMEFAVEAQKLLGVSLEGSVG